MTPHYSRCGPVSSIPVLSTAMYVHLSEAMGAYKSLHVQKVCTCMPQV